MIDCYSDAMCEPSCEPRSIASRDYRGESNGTYSRHGDTCYILLACYCRINWECNVIHRQRGYYSVYNYRIRVLNYRPQLSLRLAPDCRESDECPIGL